MIILFYPDLPRETNKVWRCCKENGYKFHNNPKKAFHVVFFWSYTKTVWRPDKFYNKLLADGQLILNNGCRNIGKDYVELVFESVFGYSSTVNPMAHKGRIVEKTIKQDDKKNIRFVMCPTRPRKGFIYQKFIDTGLVDIRVFVAQQKMQFVIYKKKKSEIFLRGLESVEMLEAKQVFSEYEINKINQFCKAFGLDFGEIDVLRDKDGRIYIIDVNNIAGNGAFRLFEPQEKKQHQGRFYLTFRDTIIKYIQDAY